MGSVLLLTFFLLMSRYIYNLIEIYQKTGGILPQISPVNRCSSMYFSYKYWQLPRYQMYRWISTDKAKHTDSICSTSVHQQYCRGPAFSMLMGSQVNSDLSQFISEHFRFCGCILMQFTQTEPAKTPCWMAHVTIYSERRCFIDCGKNYRWFLTAGIVLISIPSKEPFTLGKFGLAVKSRLNVM